VNGEYGGKGASTVYVGTSPDPKVGTRWTPEEDKLLTDTYGVYPDDVVKRNLNHRTWNGIKSRANRLKLKCRQQVLAERKHAEILAERAKSPTLDKIKAEVDKIRDAGAQSGHASMERITKKLSDKFVEHGFVTEADVSECRKGLINILNDVAAKIDAAEFVNETAKELREARRGKLSPETKTIAQQFGDVWNIERMRTTTDPKEYDRLEKIYGKTPWADDSEWKKQYAKQFEPPENALIKLPKYPGPWKDKEVTPPDISLDTPIKGGSLVRYFCDGKEVDLGGNPIPPPKLPCLLAGTRVYLCGAMDRVADGGVGWRKELVPRLKELGVVIFDPTNKPFYDNKGDESDRKTREEWVKNGEYDKIRAFVKDFRGGDLRMVNNCDFVIIYVDVNVHMCGSYEEIAIANHEKKPILVVCEQGKPRTPQWLFGMLPHEHIFSTFDDLVTYLHVIDRDGLDDDTNRWYFYRPDVLFADHVLERLEKRMV
jgi:hypothetical protein